MNRKAFVLWLIAAMPGVLCGQESRLANCRTLEAAGYFVGPDEVLDGNLVCQKSKPGDKTAPKSEPAKPEATTVAPSKPPTSVAEAARANRKQPAKSTDANAPADATAPTADAAKSAPEPVVPKTAAEPALDVTPALPTATPAVPATKPAAELPAKPVPAEPITAVKPATDSAPAPVAPDPAQPGSVPPAPPVTASAAPATRTRIVRDAPVAAGTPSEPPEKDYGFSDANAPEPPKPPRRQLAGTSVAILPRTDVRLGAFDKPKDAADAAAQAQSANSPAAFEDSQKQACAKNITLGGLQNEVFSLAGAPSVERWIAKNRNAVPGICFSNAPIPGAKNYLVVLYRMAGGNGEAAMPMPDTAAGAFTVKDGGWRYAGDSNATSVATEEASQTQIWYATAYNEEGEAVAEQWPEQSKRADNERVADELLNALLERLRKQ